MTAAYDQIVAALQHLTPEERGKIAERLKIPQSMAPGRMLSESVVGPGKPATGGMADELLDAICAVVLSASGEKIAPFGLRRAPQFKSLKEKAAALDGFFRKHAPDRATRRALVRIAVGLLYDLIREEGHPASARTLMAQVHRLPSVLDWQFPGYAACGCLHLVVRSDALGSSGGS